MQKPQADTRASALGNRCAGRANRRECAHAARVRRGEDHATAAQVDGHFGGQRIGTGHRWRDQLPGNLFAPLRRRNQGHADGDRGGWLEVHGLVGKRLFRDQDMCRENDIRSLDHGHVCQGCGS